MFCLRFWVISLLDELRGDVSFTRNPPGSPHPGTMKDEVGLDDDDYVTVERIGTESNLESR